jgi:tRNA(Ile)-lysidine synthase TilS/MesJ
MVTLQNILSTLRKAVTEYKMIAEGDRIVVGLSGGKDSLTLLTGLAAYRRFSPESYTLSAVTVDMGFPGADQTGLAAYCEKLGVPFRVIKTDVAEILFNARKEKNPCSLCSKMRRGALCGAAKEAGANKLALGHHAEDLTETFLLSCFFEGRLSTFMPVSHMDRTNVTVIRPLVLASETAIRAFAKDASLPVLFNPCPADKSTKREYIKELIKTVRQEIPNADANLFRAVISPDRYNLFKPGQT